jgi:phage antirepressor YoqD-like protein
MLQPNEIYLNGNNSTVQIAPAHETSKTFSYNGNKVLFDIKDDVMVNATQLAKIYGKRPNDYLSLPATNQLINAITRKYGIAENQLVRTERGGIAPGTWMHRLIVVDFCQWLDIDLKLWCTEKLDELMRYGMTATQPTLEQMINNPDLVISLANQLKQERKEKERLQAENSQKQIIIERKDEEISMKDDTIKVLAPKGKCYDEIMSSEGLVTTNMIAAFLGVSAIKLNKLLCEWGVQYRQSSVYFLTAKYRSKGFTRHIPYPYMDNGVQKSREHMYWTESGRKFVIELFNTKLLA